MAYEHLFHSSGCQEVHDQEQTGWQLKACFLVHRQLSSHCVLMVAVGELSGVSFDKGTSPIPEGSTHMIHSCPSKVPCGTVHSSQDVEAA